MGVEELVEWEVVVVGSRVEYVEERRVIRPD